MARAPTAQRRAMPPELYMVDGADHVYFARHGAAMSGSGPGANKPTAATMTKEAAKLGVR